MIVADLAAQAAWYERAFGLVEVAGHRPSPSIRTALLCAPNGLQLELIECVGSQRVHHFKDAAEAASVQGYGHWSLAVPDLAAAFGALIAAGAAIAKAPADGPDGARFAYVMDPEGNLIELIESSRATVA